MSSNIFIAGLSKTGTSAISQAIASSLGTPYKLYTEPTEFGTGKTSGKNFDARWHQKKCQRGNTISKCLIFPDQGRDAFSNMYETANLYNHRIWIDRDPRDRLISHTLYGWYWRHGSRIKNRGERNLWEQKFVETLEMVRQKERDCSSVNFTSLLGGWWEENYLARAEEEQRLLYNCLEAERDELKSNWHIVRYEDFIDGNLAGLSENLGTELSAEVQVTGGQRQVTRSKTYGAWRDWFTPADVEFFRPLYQGYLHSAGYDENDWRLHTPAQLNPDYGSRYLERIHPRGWINRSRDLLRLALKRGVSSG